MSLLYFKEQSPKIKFDKQYFQAPKLGKTDFDLVKGKTNKI